MATERYVRADANGSGDGTTDANSGANGAYTWAQMLTDINAGGKAGYRYNVKKGTYSRTSSTDGPTVAGGTTTAPVVIRGFNSTPGDLDNLARTSGGPLNTTDFPTISYTSGRFNGYAAEYCIFQNLIMTSASNDSTIHLGNYCEAINCNITNTGTYSGSVAVTSYYDVELCNCDILVASGASAAVSVGYTGLAVIGCRIKCPSGAGINSTAATIIGNTIYECVTGINTVSTTAIMTILGNTIANCTGDGINFLTATTQRQLIRGNHITGCGGWGIDFNTSTCRKDLGYNRFRDNASGNINGGGGWTDAGSLGNVTIDDTDALDFANAGSDDYSLLSTASGINKSYGYLNSIGASVNAASGSSSYPIIGKGAMFNG